MVRLTQWDVLEIATSVAEYWFGWRQLVKQEARLLVDEKGVAALDTARDVAQLARERRDRKSAWLWSAVAREIERREAAETRGET